MNNVINFFFLFLFFFSFLKSFFLLQVKSAFESQSAKLVPSVEKVTDRIRE